MKPGVLKPTLAWRKTTHILGTSILDFIEEETCYTLGHYIGLKHKIVHFFYIKMIINPNIFVSAASVTLINHLRKSIFFKILFIRF